MKYSELLYCFSIWEEVYKYDDMVKGKKKSVGKTSNKFENVENKNNNILNNDNMESTNNINSEQDYSDMDPFSSDENIKRNKEEIDIDKYNQIENYDYFDNFEKLKNHNKTNIHIYRRCISTPNLTRKKTMVIKKNKSFPCSHISYDYLNNTLKGTDFTYTHELHSGPKYVIDSTVSEKSFLETSQIVSNSCTNQSMGSFKFDECNGYSSSSFKFNQSNEDDGTKSIRLVLENETNNKEIKEYNKIIKTSHSLYCLNDNFNKTKKFKIKKSNSTYFNDKNISLCF
ncbi:hypothetical protein PADL01_0311700 [Plasmodium sp. gorilla clade G2]|uniref:hypothetical protein n=1 Tax=Plasmodium sp. gorilla clade G2 TaxID=880535 RepID=UPI000D21888A|nr:hypothetical protein PADL01_0311700 [Plasmodium sp. gorilla clade G2]SOV10864.1 hypothetical protein PADL01_0311700 [Plasmodium sp. gorilla clade G2]